MEVDPTTMNREQPPQVLSPVLPLGANQELADLFAADQQDRKDRVAAAEMVARDKARRERVQALLDSGALQYPIDLYHAAMVFQHGLALADYQRAHELARQSAEQGCEQARWLAAAAHDRWLHRQGKPQKYGTQYHWVVDHYELWPVDEATNDAERAAWGVPPLAAAQRTAAEMTRRHPPRP